MKKSWDFSQSMQKKRNVSHVTPSSVSLDSSDSYQSFSWWPDMNADPYASLKKVLGFRLQRYILQVQGRRKVEINVCLKLMLWNHKCSSDVILIPIKVISTNQAFWFTRPGQPSAGGPRMDHRAVTSLGVLKSHASLSACGAQLGGDLIQQ